MAKVQQPSGGRLISKEEVAKHNKQSDLWLIIHGKVYDVSKFVEEHPGGVDVINDGAGTDVTQSFEDIGHSSEARRQLAKLYIGELDRSKRAPLSVATSSNPPAVSAVSSLAVASLPSLAARPLYSYLKSETPPKLQCSICLEPFIEPQRTPCKHTFCADCISKYLEKHPSCPSCRTILRMQELRTPDETLLELLDELDVYCSKKADGCGWTGPRGNLNEHLSRTCARFACQLKDRGCEWKGTFPSMSPHSSSCDFGDASCSMRAEGCEFVCLRQNLHRHQQTCPVILKRARAEVLKSLCPSSSQVLKLDVGGTYFTTTFETLRREPSSVLAALADQLEKQKQQEVFLDADPVAFKHVLDWLRIGAVSCELPLPVLSNVCLLAKRLGLSVLVDAIALPDLPSLGDPKWKPRDGDGHILPAAQVPMSQATLLHYINTSNCANGGVLALPGANLSGLYMRNLRLEKAVLSDAILRGTKLAQSNLAGAILRNADLKGAELKGANLTGADLSGADLSNADLSDARLTDAIIANTLGIDIKSASSSLLAFAVTVQLGSYHLPGVKFVSLPRCKHPGQLVSVKGVVYSVSDGMLQEHDPVTREWKHANDLQSARHTPAAVLDSKIYVCGGNPGCCSAKLGNFDPQKNKFTLCAPMSAARCHHAVVCLEGALYAMGGVESSAGQFSASVERYDPRTEKWLPVASMLVARCRFAAVAGNGSIYAIGGALTGSTVERYDPRADKWTVVASTPSSLADPCAIATEQYIYVFVGVKAFQYDVKADKWQQMPDLPVALYGENIVAL